MQTYQAQEETKLKQALREHGFGSDMQALLLLHSQGWLNVFKHGDFSQWNAGLEALPHVQTDKVKLSDCVQVGSPSQTDLSPLEIQTALQVLHPWRKGPFSVFGTKIDTEWHSDWKWKRVLPHISSLKGKKVLDIGCGSGYHMWRMLEEGAELVVGIDPTPLFSCHFASIKRYLPKAEVFLIPTGIDDMPKSMHSFDTVFSMGILYHRREPLEHLLCIKNLLQEGGEMVLETLVVDGDTTTCLIPSGRYAKMRNVWFIPSVAMLTLWLKRVGFKDIRCVDVNTTSVEEQRTTAWMTFESLSDFLDPDDSSKTIEGYPAPKRAVMVAKA